MRFAIAALLLGGCTPLLPGDQLCPQGRGPVPGVSQPQTLGEGENHPVAIAVTGGTLFWLDQGPPNQTSDEGTVVSRDLCSGIQRVLVRGSQSRPGAMALDGGFLYWVNVGRMNGTGELKRVAQNGDDQDVRPLSSPEKRPSAIAIDSGMVYFVNQGDLDPNGVFVPGTGSLRRYELSTGTVTTLVSGLDAPSGVAAAGGVVTWTASGRGALVAIDPPPAMPIPTFAEGTGSIERLRDGQREMIAGGLNAPVAVVMSATHTWWLDRGVRRGSGRLMREDATSATGLDFPGALAVDGDDVYVAVTGAEDEMLEGHISRHRLGVPEQKLVSSQQLPRGIAVDKHLVYWVNFGRIVAPDGQVLARWKDAP
jgi:hypothetical protein